MIVVSNTSPLTNLAAIGHFELLGLLYGQVNIPEVAAAPWVHRHAAQGLGLDVIGVLDVLLEAK